MSNTQYAVCHLQRGSGNDSGMSCQVNCIGKSNEQQGGIAYLFHVPIGTQRRCIENNGIRHGL